MAVVIADDNPMQFVVNAIVEKLLADAELRKHLDFHRTPHYKAITMGKPSCHVSHIRREIEEVTPDTEESTILTAIQIQVPQTEQDSKLRALHAIETKIHKILKANSQIQDPGSSNFGWQDMKVIGVDYVVLGDGQMVVDEAILQVEVIIEETI